jgi:hypothetical protein
MKRWSEFAAAKPEMAEAGRALLYQFRVGLGDVAILFRTHGHKSNRVA